MDNRRKMTRLRDNELLRDYREKLAEAMKRGGTINRKEIVREVLRDGHPRYYLNFDQAYNVMSQIKNHGMSGRKLTLKQQMWMEIYEKVQRESLKNPNLAIHAVLARVLLTERASRYFISENYAYKYLYDVQHEQRKKIVGRRA